jgi:hypothetical protein
MKGDETKAIVSHFIKGSSGDFLPNNKSISFNWTAEVPAKNSIQRSGVVGETLIVSSMMRHPNTNDDVDEVTDFRLQHQSP